MTTDEMRSQRQLHWRGHTSYSDYQLFRMGIDCPHCGVFSMAYGPQFGGRHLVLTCDSCRRPALLELDGDLPEYITGASHQAYEESIKGLNMSHMYPTPMIKFDTLSTAIPPEVRKDFAETRQCYLMQAPRACCAMARRCVQTTVKDKGAKGRDLQDQIDDLLNKQIINADLADLAQNIRVFGNYGAHPSVDYLKDATMDDAQVATEFCEHLLTYIYVLREKVNKSRVAAKAAEKKPVKGATKTATKTGTKP